MTDRFFIDEPCPEDLSRMPQARGGRHCAACDHIVLDATSMTRDAFLRYVQQSGGKVCAQIRADDRGEAVFRSPPPPQRAPRRHYSGGLVLLSALTAGGCTTEPPEGPIAVQTPVAPQEVPLGVATAENTPTQTTPPATNPPADVPDIRHIAGGIRHVPDEVDEPTTPPPSRRRAQRPSTAMRGLLVEF